MLHRIKLRIYDVLVDVEVDKTIERRLAIALMILIVVNGLAVMLETVKFWNNDTLASFTGLKSFQ